MKMARWRKLSAWRGKRALCLLRRGRGKLGGRGYVSSGRAPQKVPFGGLSQRGLAAMSYYKITDSGKGDAVFGKRGLLEKS